MCVPPKTAMTCCLPKGGQMDQRRWLPGCWPTPCWWPTWGMPRLSWPGHPQGVPPPPRRSCCRKSTRQSTKWTELSKQRGGLSMDASMVSGLIAGVCQIAPPYVHHNPGRLEVSRAFGDPDFKSKGLSCVPDVTAFSILPQQDRFLLLACDGFFTVFSPQEAVHAAVQLLEEKRDAKWVCVRLLHQAIRERKCKDNCTLVLCVFGGTMPGT